MSKKKLNLIIGSLLVAIGIILILCGAFPNIIDYLVGGACCAAAVAFVVRSLISTRKVLTAQILVAAVLLAAGIALFVLGSGVGIIVLTILNYSLITVGVLLLIDTIVYFVKKRQLAINIVELVIAVALLVIGIITVIPETNNVPGLVFYFSGAVVIFAGIVVICASLINFSKYAKIPSEPSKSNDNVSNNSSKKNKKKSHK